MEFNLVLHTYLVSLGGLSLEDISLANDNKLEVTPQAWAKLRCNVPSITYSMLEEYYADS